MKCDTRVISQTDKVDVVVASMGEDQYIELLSCSQELDYKQCAKAAVCINN